MNRSRHISILVPSLVPYDAIGNDVAQMRLALVQGGYAVRIFAEGIHPACASIADSIHHAPDELWQSSESVLIYHHSTWWPRGEELLRRTRNKVILKYHNITPSRFFAPYSEPHSEACALGIQSTSRILKLGKMLVVGDSIYNCEDLIALGANPGECRVLPPFHLTEELGSEMFDHPTLSRFSGAGANILFVGGVKPNKGHARAMRIFALYKQHFNDRSRLIFAGSLDERLAGYVNDLKALAGQLGIADQVVFTGPVTGAQLKSLYVSADVFLCASEHEGFCVPLVESMYFRLPIVAWGVTAVRETVDECGFVIDDWDEHLLAAHIDRTIEDDRTAEHFGDLGRRRYKDTFAPKVLRQKLNGIIAEVMQ